MNSADKKKRKKTSEQYTGVLRTNSTLCIFVSLQMVGVSDDVNEYALALKDTEEKIKRCPKRVRMGPRAISRSHRGPT